MWDAIEKQQCMKTSEKPPLLQLQLMKRSPRRTYMSFILHDGHACKSMAAVASARFDKACRRPDSSTDIVQVVMRSHCSAGKGTKPTRFWSRTGQSSKTGSPGFYEHEFGPELVQRPTGGHSAEHLASELLARKRRGFTSTLLPGLQSLCQRRLGAKGEMLNCFEGSGLLLNSVKGLFF